MINNFFYCLFWKKVFIYQKILQNGVISKFKTSDDWFIDSFRDILEEISQDLGVIDPVSDPLIIDESGLVAELVKTISVNLKV